MLPAMAMHFLSMAKCVLKRSHYLFLVAWLYHSWKVQSFLKSYSLQVVNLRGDLTYNQEGKEEGKPLPATSSKTIAKSEQEETEANQAKLLDLHRNARFVDPVLHRQKLDEMEAAQNAIDPHSENKDAGMYGPDTLSWEVLRESANFIAGGRATLLQAAHPFVAYGIQQHSDIGLGISLSLALSLSLSLLYM